MAVTPVKIICQFLVLRKDLCLLCSKNIEKQYRVFDKFGGRGAAYKDAVYLTNCMNSRFLFNFQRKIAILNSVQRQ